MVLVDLSIMLEGRSRKGRTLSIMRIYPLLSSQYRNNCAEISAMGPKELLKNRLSTTEMAVKLGKTACNNLSATIMVAILL